MNATRIVNFHLFLNWKWWGERFECVVMCFARHFFLFYFIYLPNIYACIIEGWMCVRFFFCATFGRNKLCLMIRWAIIRLAMLKITETFKWHPWAHDWLKWENKKMVFVYNMHFHLFIYLFSFLVQCAFFFFLITREFTV